MRLIDADELKKEFKDSPIGLAMKKLVDTQPTAYDVDKVVEELFDDDFVRYDDDFVIPIDRAIEIVRLGAKRGDRVNE